MASLSPIAITLFIVFVVALVGLIIAHFRDRATYAGYEEISGEILRISRSLKGDVFRDGGDLVVSGNYYKLPVIVRFSRSDNTPGMNVRMSSPAVLTLSVAPRGLRISEGRALVRTPDDMFDSRFTTRSNHPEEVRFLLESDTVNAALHKVMCSQQTFLTMTTGSIELSEQAIPTPGTARHVVDHLDSMRRLALSAAGMQAADSVAVHELRKERAIVGRLAIAVGLITAVLVVVGSWRSRPSPPLAGPADSTQAAAGRGVLPIDAPLVPQAGRYRVATEADLDPAALAWLRRSGAVNPGRVPGNYSGSGGPREVAYLLLGDSGKRRVVLLSGGATRLDSEYPEVGLIARVPRPRLDSVPWVGPKPSTPPDGDGLLIVRNPADPASGLVLYLSSGRVVSGVPRDFHQIGLD